LYGGDNDIIRKGRIIGAPAPAPAPAPVAAPVKAKVDADERAGGGAEKVNGVANADVRLAKDVAPPPRTALTALLAYVPYAPPLLLA
jgi:hypothetical protein